MFSGAPEETTSKIALINVYNFDAAFLFIFIKQADSVHKDFLLKIRHKCGVTYFNICISYTFSVQ